MRLLTRAHGRPTRIVSGDEEIESTGGEAEDEDRMESSGENV